VLQEPPFKDAALLPLSPYRSNKFLSPPLSPTNLRSPGHSAASIAYAGQSVFSPSARYVSAVLCFGLQYCVLLLQLYWVVFLVRFAESLVSPATRSSGVLSPERYGSPESYSRPTSPDGLGGSAGIYSSYTMGQGLEGLICTSPDAVRRTRCNGCALCKLTCEPCALLLPVILIGSFLGCFGDCVLLTGIAKATAAGFKRLAQHILTCTKRWNDMRG
jgi:hypothetical protein